MPVGWHRQLLLDGELCCKRVGSLHGFLEWHQWPPVPSVEFQQVICSLVVCHSVNGWIIVDQAAVYLACGLAARPLPSLQFPALVWICIVWNCNHGIGGSHRAMSHKEV